MNTSTEGVIYGALTAIVLVVFIGGCTAHLLSVDQSARLKVCLENKMQWQDGSCSPASRVLP